MNRLQFAVEQIVFARNYTDWLLEGTPAADWFRQPAGGVSLIGWQVGHIAFAEYRLTLFRIRGPKPEDAALVSEEFLRQFGANSVPVAEPAKYPPPTEIRKVLDRVHEQSLRELAGLDDAELDQQLSYPHPYAKTKLSSLLWCGHHEMVHAGQIGLLRRQLGHTPLW